MTTKHMKFLEDASIEIRPDSFVEVENPENKEQFLRFYPKKNEDGTWSLVATGE